MFIFKILSALIWNIVIFGGLLFLPAGTLNWWRAWVFLGVVVVGTVATMVAVFREDDELYKERLKPPIQEGQPQADKILASLTIASFLGLIAFIPLDVFRFHLFAQPSAIASMLGLVVYVIGWSMISLSFKENTFAATAVKHQADRQQTVIDTGVYSIVRHPMYAGAVW